MSEQATAHSFRQSPMLLKSKCNVLIELWEDYSHLNYFDELFEYGNTHNVYQNALLVDLGFSNVPEPEIMFIEKAWTMLLEKLGLEDVVDYTDLDEVFTDSDWKGYLDEE